jgi:hypothetical protein
MSKFPDTEEDIFIVYYFNRSVPDDDGIVVTGVFPTAELAEREADFLTRHNSNPDTFFGWHKTRYFPHGVDRHR